MGWKATLAHFSRVSRQMGLEVKDHTKYHSSAGNAHIEQRERERYEQGFGRVKEKYVVMWTDPRDRPIEIHQDDMIRFLVGWLQKPRWYRIGQDVYLGLGAAETIKVVREIDGRWTWRMINFEGLEISWSMPSAKAAMEDAYRTRILEVTA